MNTFSDLPREIINEVLMYFRPNELGFIKMNPIFDVLSINKQLEVHDKTKKISILRMMYEDGKPVYYCNNNDYSVDLYSMNFNKITNNIFFNEKIMLKFIINEMCNSHEHMKYFSPYYCISIRSTLKLSDVQEFLFNFAYTKPNIKQQLDNFSKFEIFEDLMDGDSSYDINIFFDNLSMVNTNVKECKNKFIKECKLILQDTMTRDKFAEVYFWICENHGNSIDQQEFIQSCKKIKDMLLDIVDVYKPCKNFVYYHPLIELIRWVIFYDLYTSIYYINNLYNITIETCVDDHEWK